jgi:hypothetical protein
MPIEVTAMFDHKHYVPILGGKAGEYRALRELSPARKAKLTPLIEVPPVPWDFENDRPACSIDVHLQGTAKAIEDHWGLNDVLFVDMFTVADEGPMASGDHPVKHVFDDARRRNVKAIPVTGIDRDADYQTAVRNTIAADGRGVCVRVLLTDIVEDAAFATDLTQLLATLGVAPNAVDLLIDAGPMLPAHESTYLLATRSAISLLPNINDWRSLTVAGSAFPTDMSGFTRDAISSTPRTEWRVWTALAAGRASLRRMPTFGDYSVDAPGHDQLDFRVIKMTANIRYCHTADWILVKGHVIRKGSASQHPGLAATLRARPEYSGAAFSWGDNYVDECARGVCGPGNATTWRQVGVNHHLSFVVEQIASHPGL